MNFDSTLTIPMICTTWFPQDHYRFSLIQEQLEPYQIEYYLLAKPKNRPWVAKTQWGKVKVIEWPGLTINSGWWEVAFNLPLSPRLSRLKPVLIGIRGWVYPSYVEARTFALKRSIPYILWLGGKGKGSVYARFPGNFFRWISNSMAQSFLRESKFIFVYGSIAKREMIELGADEEKVIIIKQTVLEEDFDYKHYMNLDRYSFRKNLGIDERPLFLFIGQLIPRKGIEDLLRAFTELINKKKKEAQLLIIGKGELKNLVDEYSKRFQYNITYIPSVPYKEIQLYYCISDFFVFPTHFDDWGYTVNESHCCKIPIICSDGAHSAYDLIKQGYSGLVYKAGEIKELVECMEYALNNPSNMQRMAEKGYDFIQSEWNSKESARIWSKYIKIALNER